MIKTMQLNYDKNIEISDYVCLSICWKSNTAITRNAVGMEFKPLLDSDRRLETFQNAIVINLTNFADKI